MNVEEGGLDVILDICCLHSKMQIQQCWGESIEWFGLLLRNFLSQLHCTRLFN
jgi:hypothetical protein